MTVIGITGPTGAGKTTALDVLAELGFEIVDCDALYYRLLQTDEGLRRGLRGAFGEVPAGRKPGPAGGGGAGVRRCAGAEKAQRCGVSRRVRSGGTKNSRLFTKRTCY